MRRSRWFGLRVCSNIRRRVVSHRRRHEGRVLPLLPQQGGPGRGCRRALVRRHRTLFATATYHDLADPATACSAYIDLRRRLIGGSPAQFSCYAGTLAQRTFVSNPRSPTRAEPRSSTTPRRSRPISTRRSAHTDGDGVDAAGLAATFRLCCRVRSSSARLPTNPQCAVESIDHLRRYVQMLLARPTNHRDEEMRR